MKIRNWDPNNGDALQGDVCLFRIPDHITIDTSDEIRPDPTSGRLILASGVLTGHHHAIDKAKSGTANFYRDPQAVAALVRAGDLTTDRLVIGLLIVEGGPVVLRHDEHDAIRIPPGRYFVGGQMELSAAEARRVAD